MRSGLPRIDFPGLLRAREQQVRDGEACESSFRLAPATGRPLVADLAAGAGRSTGKRRNRRGVIVGFDLHQRIGVSSSIWT